MDSQIYISRVQICTQITTPEFSSRDDLTSLFFLYDFNMAQIQTWWLMVSIYFSVEHQEDIFSDRN